MDEKDTKSLTINDILDQLTKPSVLKEPQAPVRPSAPLPSLQTAQPKPQSQPQNQPPKRESVQLPHLGGVKESDGKSINIPGDQSSPELKLSIRTMSADITRLREGEKPASIEFNRFLGEKPLPPAPTPAPKPIVPPLSPRSAPLPPPIPSASGPQPKKSAALSLGSDHESGTEVGHFHPEKVISDSGLKDQLPEFLGAPVPKKMRQPAPEEKVEYGLIARLIGSGMTTGILSTIILAIGLWLVLSYFVFNTEEVVTPTPTPIATVTETPSTTNELETIFKNYTVINYTFSDGSNSIISDLKSFINNQSLQKKEFKIFNFVTSENQKLSFNDILGKLSIIPPSELTNHIADNYIVMIYGQEESFDRLDSGTMPIPKRMVFVAEINNPEQAKELIKAWEPVLPQNFKELLGIDPSKQASQNFLDNNYRGIPIRYKNFPLPDKSLDYSIIKSLTGKSYLLITNSRESIYAPADIIMGL